MTINRKCLVKSLKKDYWDIGWVTTVCFLVGICAYTAFCLTSLYVNQIYEGLQLVARFVIQPISSPTIIFIIVELFTIFALVYWILFIPTAGKSKDEIKEWLNESGTTTFVIIVTVSSMVVIYVCYLVTAMILAAERINIPDVNMIMVGLLVLDVFIICPVAVAVARCKE